MEMFADGQENQKKAEHDGVEAENVEKRAQIDILRDELDKKVRERSQEIEKLSPEQREAARAVTDSDTLLYSRTVQDVGRDGAEKLDLKGTLNAYDEQKEAGISEQEAKSAPITSNGFLAAFGKKGGTESYHKPIQAKNGLPDMSGDFAKVKDVQNDSTERDSTPTVKAELGIGPIASG